jgi:hypothetical protein
VSRVPSAPALDPKAGGAQLDRARFEAEYKRLVASYGKGTANVGCLACEGCQRCADCTFCSGSTDLSRSHYCEACEGCIDSSHLLRCKGCLACSHCVECERCTGCAYVTRSIGCAGCTYCFGCVGLSKKDFYILNEPYDRQTYFAIVAKLARDLRLPV